MQDLWLHLYLESDSFPALSSMHQSLAICNPLDTFELQVTGGLGRKENNYFYPVCAKVKCKI